jgi:hypothetical protein
MPDHPYLQPVIGGALLRVKVQPRAPRNEVVGVLGEELKIKIAAPPVDSAANDSLVEFLAARLGCPRRAITLVRGHRSPHKTLALHGISRVEAAARLLPGG